MSRILAFALLLLGLGVSAHAAPVAYTVEADFLAALSGAGLSTGGLDFDSETPGVANGATLTTQGALAVGITLPGPVPDVFGGTDLDVAVVAAGAPFPAGAHVLGTDDPANLDQFIANTVLSFSFATPLTAFGLTLISGDTQGGPSSPSCCLFDGDVLLDVAVGGAPQAVLDVDDGELLFTVNPGPGQTEIYGYFLGVNAEAPFTSATLSYAAAVPDGGFFFVLDDLVLAPEPGTGLLLGAGLLGMAVGRPRSRPGRRARCG